MNDRVCVCEFAMSKFKWFLDHFLKIMIRSLIGKHQTDRNRNYPSHHAHWVQCAMRIIFYILYFISHEHELLRNWMWVMKIAIKLLANKCIEWWCFKIGKLKICNKKNLVLWQKSREITQKRIQHTLTYLPSMQILAVAWWVAFMGLIQIKFTLCSPQMVDNRQNTVSLLTPFLLFFLFFLSQNKISTCNSWIEMRRINETILSTLNVLKKRGPSE